MQPQQRVVVTPRPAQGRAQLQAMSTKEIVAELTRKASLLAKKEVALATSEAKEDLRAEIRMVSGLGAAGVCAILTVQMLLVALVFGLSEAGVMSGWLASLIVAAVVLAIGTVAGLVGWKMRVRAPLDATRRSIEEGVTWVKERTA